MFLNKMYVLFSSVIVIMFGRKQISSNGEGDSMDTCNLSSTSVEYRLQHSHFTSIT